MNKKTLTAIGITLLLLLILLAYLTVDSNAGGIFRTATPTLTNITTPTNTSTPTFTTTMTATSTATATQTPTTTQTPTNTPTPTLTWDKQDNDADGVLNGADQCPDIYADTSNGCPENNNGREDGPPVIND